jgi:uncharacterized protein (TIGR03545 family)
MKWKSALYKLAAFAALYVVVYFCFDPILRWVAVKAGERAVRAKVEIASLKTGLFPPRLELTGVAVADAREPMKNLFEFERAAFSLEGAPLLERKFIVHEAAVTGLRLSSERKTSGAIALTASAPGAGNTLLASVKGRAAQFSLDKIASAKEGLKEKFEVTPGDLESVRLAGELKEKYSRSAAEWEKKLKDADFN